MTLTDIITFGERGSGSYSIQRVTLNFWTETSLPDSFY